MTLCRCICLSINPLSLGQSKPSSFDFQEIKKSVKELYALELPSVRSGHAFAMQCECTFKNLLPHTKYPHPSSRQLLVLTIQTFVAIMIFIQHRFLVILLCNFLNSRIPELTRSERVDFHSVDDQSQ